MSKDKSLFNLLIQKLAGVGPRIGYTIVLYSYIFFLLILMFIFDVLSCIYSGQRTATATRYGSIEWIFKREFIHIIYNLKRKEKLWEITETGLRTPQII